MTAKEVAKALGAKVDPVRLALKSMPDTYVDRWEGPKRGQYAEVFCVVIPPPDCPHPTRRD